MIYNNLYLFWRIGKYCYDNNDKYNNVFSRCSVLFSYKFGISELFSIGNIKNMRNFYCCFPIFFDRLFELSWEHYRKLSIIKNEEERNFYFRVCLFCKTNSADLEKLILNDYFYLIKKDKF